MAFARNPPNAIHTAPFRNDDLLSLLFSLVAGLGSLCLTGFLKKVCLFGTVGISVAGAVLHNVLQLGIALFVVGRVALYYTPVLLLSGAVCGFLVGVISQIITKRLK